MPEIRFTRAAPDRCPAYKDYYIQDRYVGRDIYGHEAYEYALFRRLHFRTVRRFRKRKQAYKYLSDLTGLTRWEVKMGSYHIVSNTRDALCVIHGRAMYRLEKRTNEIRTRPVDDEKLSGWYERYAECLAAAKETVKRLEAGASMKI